MNNAISYFVRKLEHEIDSFELNSYLKKGEKIMVIDVRPKEYYEKEHIPGSVNLPQSEIDEKSTEDFSSEFLYVTYCDGVGCNASARGAVKLARFGFKVVELVGGIEWWKKDGYKTVTGDSV